jgi:hypothetical protein
MSSVLISSDEFDLLASTGWWPIETAPRDGTTILVYEPGFFHTAAWEANEFKAGWTNASGSWLGDVTHWMPLPGPPK